MTALSYSPTRKSSVVPLLLIVMAAIVLAVGAPVITHQHAVAKHGAEAERVRNCAQDSNPFQVWQKRDSDRYHCLYQMDDGRIGDQIVQPDSSGFWHEITSFIRSERNLAGVMRALAKEAVQVFPK